MITIRHEKIQDIGPIRLVNECAFGQPDEANLVDTLRRKGLILLSLVATHNDQVVGHIVFSPVTIGSGSSEIKAAGLGPMAVVPEYQRKGIGSQLVRSGLIECVNTGIDIVVVLGHPTYYPRFGFTPASGYGIHCEYDVPDEAFMIIELRKGVLEKIAGVAKYQPEFRGV